MNRQPTADLRERILGQYLLGEVSREQAIERAGIDQVELAEQQYAAMREDLTWAEDLDLTLEDLQKSLQVLRRIW